MAMSNPTIKLKKPRPSEMCPPGHHMVRGHKRVCASGTTTWVDAHIRRNPKKKIKILLIENLHYSFWNSKKKYNKLNAIKGYPAHHELDPIIQFWLDYWKQQGLEFPSIDPLLIKTIIAIESTFNPAAEPKSKDSSALGLMQITDQTRRLLAGIPNKNDYREVLSNYLRLSRKDIFDPVVNIAAGTRWLIYKYKIIPKRAPKTIYNAVKYYYSWNTAGEKYAKKVFDLYKKSK